MTARLKVDLDALARNYARFAAASAGRAGAVLKANAYGTGVAPVAARLWRAGCRTFFVANAAEGLALRATQPSAEIYVFEGALESTADELAAANLVPVMNDPAQFEAWRPHRAKPVALHVDTGMRRLGLDWEGATDRIPAGFDVALLMTHLACADQPEHPANALQLERFEAVRRALPGVPVSVCNSAALLAGLGTDDLSRPGVGLYGGNPFPGGANPMEVVAVLEACILQIRDVAAGEAVGYGWTHRAVGDRRLAVVGAGYADGLPRLLSNRGFVCAAGVRRPIVGRVTMDLTTIDVTGAALEPGDWVELFGRSVPVDEVGAWAGSIGYEVLCGVGSRVPRVYT